MKKIILLIFLLSDISYVFARPANTTILVDAKALQKANPDKVMLDGEVYVDLDNDKIKDIIRYAYSASTPPAACSDKNCIQENNTGDQHPILTFEIFLKRSGATISVNYMCTSIGLMKSSHNGMKDLYCGSSSILQWNGEDYVEKTSYKLQSSQ